MLYTHCVITILDNHKAKKVIRYSVTLRPNQRWSLDLMTLQSLDIRMQLYMCLFVDVGTSIDIFCPNHWNEQVQKTINFLDSHFLLPKVTLIQFTNIIVPWQGKHRFAANQVDSNTLTPLTCKIGPQIQLKTLSDYHPAAIRRKKNNNLAGSCADTKMREHGSSKRGYI